MYLNFKYGGVMRGKNYKKIAIIILIIVFACTIFILTANIQLGNIVFVGQYYDTPQKAYFANYPDDQWIPTEECALIQISEDYSLWFTHLENSIPNAMFITLMKTRGTPTQYYSLGDSRLIDMSLVQSSKDLDEPATFITPEYAIECHIFPQGYNVSAYDKNYIKQEFTYRCADGYDKLFVAYCRTQ